MRRTGAEISSHWMISPAVSRRHAEILSRGTLDGRREHAAKTNFDLPLTESQRGLKEFEPAASCRGETRLARWSGLLQIGRRSIGTVSLAQ